MGGDHCIINLIILFRVQDAHVGMDIRLIVLMLHAMAVGFGR